MRTINDWSELQGVVQGLDSRTQVTVVRDFLRANELRMTGRITARLFRITPGISGWEKQVRSMCEKFNMVDLVEFGEVASSQSSLNEVVGLLCRYKRRATYGAVAGYLGFTEPFAARGLMMGRPKCQRDSWVVAKDTGLPSGYSRDDMAVGLEDSGPVLSSNRVLRSEV